ncbi:MAG: SlyX family protein [Halieaceae bacterium]
MSESNESLLQQLHELQSQLAFQEDALESLNGAMAAQQQEILVLRRQLELLKQRQDEQMAGAGSGAQADNADEKPPHY